MSGSDAFGDRTFPKKHMKAFKISGEGGQHGDLDLLQFADLMKKAGAQAFLPSCYQMLKKDGTVRKAEDVRQVLETTKLDLTGASLHCLFWALGALHTGTQTVVPFLPDAILAEPTESKRRTMLEDLICELLDLLVELNCKIVPMFYGPHAGHEVASGYNFGFWKGGKDVHAYDLLSAGNDRFLRETKRIREKALGNGQVLASEIHPNTFVLDADGFDNLLTITGNEKCQGIWVDFSHCDEGETPDDRYGRKSVAERIYGGHPKNYAITPGRASRIAQMDWRKRRKMFSGLRRGDLSMSRFLEVIIDSGAHERVKALCGWDQVHIAVETEGAYGDLKEQMADDVAYMNEINFTLAGGSFEEGMGS